MENTNKMNTNEITNMYHMHVDILNDIETKLNMERRRQKNNNLYEDEYHVRQNMKVIAMERAIVNTLWLVLGRPKHKLNGKL